MNREKEYTGISRFLSLVLRHKPETIELSLDQNGWADVTILIEKMNGRGFQITPAILHHIVQTNNKKRFSFNHDGTRIRANQGHSIPVELNLQEIDPPEYLYHGTGDRFVIAILKKGLEKRSRQHVHLSIDEGLAREVGRRHGRPKVFRVAAEQMSNEGFKFYLSANNVWLTDHVPARYLDLIEQEG